MDVQSTFFQKVKKSRKFSKNLKKKKNKKGAEKADEKKADDVDLPEWWEIAQIPIRTTDAIPTSIDRPAAVEFTQALENRSWR